MNNQEEILSQLKGTLALYVHHLIEKLGKMQVYTTGYLKVKFVEDSLLWDRWEFEKDSRNQLNLSLLAIHFFQSDKISIFVKYLLDLIKKSPFLLEKLTHSPDEMGWDISLRHFEGAVWDSFYLPYLQKSWFENQAIIFDQKVFDEVFDDFISDLYSESIVTEKVLMPLSALKLADEEIQLDSNIKLRRIRSGDIEDWINKSGHLTQLPDVNFDINEVRYLFSALEITYSRERDFYNKGNLLKKVENSLQERKRISKLLGNLRLITNYPVRIAFIQKSERGFLNRRISKETYAPFIPLKTGRESIRINSEQQSTLTDFWKKLETGSMFNYINVPFSRWSRGIERADPADKLIDFWIALESLFAPEFNQELRFRCALRIAAFLGLDYDKQEEIYKEMQHSYDWRSNVVHGGNPEQHKKLTKKGGLEETTLKTGLYLREAILRILKSGDPLTIKPGESEFSILKKLNE